MAEESKEVEDLNEGFIEWAKDNSVSLEHKEDWLAWYECWANGYSQCLIEIKNYVGRQDEDDLLGEDNDSEDKNGG